MTMSPTPPFARSAKYARVRSLQKPPSSSVFVPIAVMTSRLRSRILPIEPGDSRLENFIARFLQADPIVCMIFGVSCSGSGDHPGRVLQLGELDDLGIHGRMLIRLH